jgi:hypothetical protein
MDGEQVLAGFLGRFWATVGDLNKICV